MQILVSTNMLTLWFVSFEEQSAGKIRVSGLNALSLIDMYGCGRILVCSCGVRTTAFNLRWNSAACIRC